MKTTACGGLDDLRHVRKDRNLCDLLLLDNLDESAIMKSKLRRDKNESKMWFEVI